MLYKTIDFTRRYWGHDYVYTPTEAGGLKANVMGWYSGKVHIGDRLLLQGPNGGASPYVVTEILQHIMDPADMFHVKVEYDA